MFTCLIHPSSFRLHPYKGITPQIRIHGVSIIFHRTGEKRFISITSTKPPKLKRLIRNSFPKE